MNARKSHGVLCHVERHGITRWQWKPVGFLAARFYLQNRAIARQIKCQQWLRTLNTWKVKSRFTAFPAL
jgi:hypothetical protein